MEEVDAAKSFMFSKNVARGAPKDAVNPLDYEGAAFEHDRSLIPASLQPMSACGCHTFYHTTSTCPAVAKNMK